MSTPNLLRVIVPMKPIHEGKSRLASVLDSEGRAALCLLLLQHVLSVVSRAATPLETWVIGGDEWVRSIASQESALWQADPGGGLNEVVRKAAISAFDEGVPAIIVLPGDLGFLGAKDVDNLVTLSDGLRRAVLARAVTDGGTNAILAPRGLLVGPYFGPGSFTHHLDAARNANISVEVSLTPGLSFDLDTPADLSMYQANRPDFDGVLASWRERLRSQASGKQMKKVGATTRDA